MFKTGGTKFGAFGNFAESNTSSALSTPKPNDSKNTETKSGSSKFEPTDFVPKRFGLKYDPPAIILEYLILSSGKLYHHKMKMPQLKANSDTQETYEALRKKHQDYFTGNKVSESQIKVLIDKLKKKLEGSSTTGTFITGSSLTTTKQDSKTVTRDNAKTSFDTKSFNSFGAAKDTFGLTSQATKVEKVPEKKPEPKKAKDAGNNFWDFEDIEDLEEDNEVDYNTANLNKLTKEELDKHKEKMNNVFSKNQKKPGEAGFIYDKQEEFVPTQNNDWDEDF